MTSIGGQPVTSTIGNYSLVGNRLSFSMLNTSLSGTITAIGFDLSGVDGTYSLLSASNNNFELKNDVGAQAGAQNFVSSFDIALLTGSNYGGGKVAEGIGAGNSASFNIGGDFGSLTAEQIAQGAYARFQGIGKQDGSDVTRVTTPPTTVVPEPGTFALVAAGLLPIAGGITRRRIRRA